MSKSVEIHGAQELETRMTRFGLRVAAGLSERNETLPADISERLRFAREQALLKALQAAKQRSRVAVQAPQMAGAAVRMGNTLALSGGSGGSPIWLKLMSGLPLLLLVAGLFLIQHGQSYAQIRAAAEVDTALLSDNVPPAAYSDPGFSQYLSDDQD